MNPPTQAPKFVVLAILDGWGIAPDSPGNAISLAKTVNINKYWLSYPHTTLEASGQAVGLPRGEDGNTETGHLNLGAGRIVYQDLERINMAIADGTFFKNDVLIAAIDNAKKNNSNLHIMGLVGAGGVHSNLDHLFALIHLCSEMHFERVFLHIFTDGRDSPPTSAKTYIKTLETVLERERVGKIASIMGRYWAMDRDQRWERTQKAYEAMVNGKANYANNCYEVIEKSYSEGKTDEFIEPTLITDKNGKPVTLISNNDSIVFFNFRIDRPRQLTKAFVYADFKKARTSFPLHKDGDNNDSEQEDSSNQTEPFKREQQLKDIFFVTMTSYGKMLVESGAIPAFPPEIIENPISAIVSSHDIKQLKITESEKERFVTFYFNGLREMQFNNEERIIIPSPKVPTYDQKPEMSSSEVMEELLKRLETGLYGFVVINFPNADMVGHTGNIGAAVKAIETVDDAIGKLANFTLAYNGVLIITADHGNAEEMINLQSGEIDTEHSINPVPFIAVGHQFVGKSQTLRSGILADVAPTILSLLNIPIPSSMAGRNLLSGL